MKTNFYLFILTVVAFFAQNSYSQEKKANNADFQPDRKKPSVFITFERSGGSKPLVTSNEDKSERISLRLRNNTSSPIAVDANWEISNFSPLPITLSDGGKGDAVPDGAEVEVCYESEAMPQMTAEEFFKIQVPKQIPSYYNCRWREQRSGKESVWIPAGSSIVFSVPREFLAKNLKIYTLFNYESESENGRMNADEPHHQVYFYSTDLLYNLRRK